jgi:hypothetical protein
VSLAKLGGYKEGCPDNTCPTGGFTFVEESVRRRKRADE